MALTKIGSIGINTGIQFAGVTTIATLNASDNVLSVGGTVNFVSDVSIGGTVSIAGTLTYEDVTNVDAIGIITARSEIKVGSGITLSKDGDIFATGISTFSEGIAGDLLIDDKIVHRGDTDTAIRFPAADTITAETGGSERVRIDSSGNFGVGTNNPTTKVHIQQSAVTSAPSRSSALYLENNANCEIQFVGNSSNDCQLRFGTSSNSFKGAIEYELDNNNLIHYTNGNERLRIDSDGQIGIGNIAPDTWSTGKSITIGTAQATLWGVGDQVNLSGNAYFNSGWKAAATKAGASQIQQSLGNIDFRVTGSINADAAITWTDALRIDPYGRVLIGGTSAIIGSSSEFNEIVLTGKTRGAGITLQDVDANTRFQIRTDDDGGDPQTLLNASTNHPITIRTNNTERLRITSTGGLEHNGGSAAHYVLTNSGKAANHIHVDGPAGNSGEMGGAISFDCGGTGCAAIAGLQQSADPDKIGLAFIVHKTSTASDDAIEAMRIDNDGHFRFGTTSVIQNEKYTFFRPEADQNTLAYFHSGASSDVTGVIFRHGRALSGFNGKQIGFLRSDGTEVGSIISGASSTSFNTSSDYRLKENAVSISDGITRLKTLKPYKFNFKDEPSVTVDGFFAHEVTAVPQAVHGEKDAIDDNGDPKYQTIDHSKLVPLLTAALQEAITEIETLKEKVAALEG